MKYLSEIPIFIALVNSLSITQVAKEQNLTVAAVSASLKRLEKELGVILFIRSTRSMRLSEAGETFYPFAKEAFSKMQEGVQACQNNPNNFAGTLRVSVPADLGRNVIVPHLQTFLRQYPKVKLRLFITDTNADLYSSEVDFAIRYGQPESSNLIARPLVENNHRIVCASPSYINQYGMPNSPNELTKHQCATFMRHNRVFDDWHFYQGNDYIKQKMDCQQVMNDGEMVRRWAVSGHGIVCKSKLDLAEDLRLENLVQVCPEWQCEQLPLYLLYADRRQMTPIAKGFHQSLLNLFESLD